VLLLSTALPTESTVLPPKTNGAGGLHDVVGDIGSTNRDW